MYVDPPNCLSLPNWQPLGKYYYYYTRIESLYPVTTHPLTHWCVCFTEPAHEFFTRLQLFNPFDRMRLPSSKPPTLLVLGLWFGNVGSMVHNKWMDGVIGWSMTCLLPRKLFLYLYSHSWTEDKQTLWWLSNTRINSEFQIVITVNWLWVNWVKGTRA